MLCTLHQMKKKKEKRKLAHSLHDFNALWLRNFQTNPQFHIKAKAFIMYTTINFSNFQ